ncbi:MAG: phosphopantetheine-binding protein [Planctomycetaceae bacterium]|nr:phosphopantetheine-binding protein [Planctomycetaceae bacterium]
MAFNRQQIEEGVTEVLEEALGVDAEDVKPEATLTGDLGAESIDFLDISFRMEKKFSTPEKPFKIEQGELFPENMLQDPAMVQNGKVTDAGMVLLRQKLPHIDFTTFDKDRNVKSLSEVFTVKSLCDFLERKLAK